LFFFPYRALIALHRVPVVTIFVCILCIGVYIAQDNNRRTILKRTQAFCTGELSIGLRQALAQWRDAPSRAHACAEIMLSIHVAPDRNAAIGKMAAEMGKTPGVKNANLTAHYRDILTQEYRQFRAPPYLTAKLQYPPRSWNPVRMLTAAVAHGSWLHLIGNLFFFYVFAATVELLLGPILYLMLLTGLALGTHVVYSVATMGNPDALPTLGLSGVVMGTIALFSYFLPRARIRCFLWILIFFRRFVLPAWLIAIWFIGVDTYTVLAHGTGGHVNLVAHLAGAALALTTGLLVFREKRHWARELIER